MSTKWESVAGKLHDISTKWKSLTGELYNISYPRSEKVWLEKSAKSFFYKVENVLLGELHEFHVRDFKKLSWTWCQWNVKFEII